MLNIDEIEYQTGEWHRYLKRRGQTKRSNVKHGKIMFV